MKNTVVLHIVRVLATVIPLLQAVDRHLTEKL